MENPDMVTMLLRMAIRVSRGEQRIDLETGYAEIEWPTVYTIGGPFAVRVIRSADGRVTLKFAYQTNAQNDAEERAFKVLLGTLRLL